MTACNSANPCFSITPNPPELEIGIMPAGKLVGTINMHDNAGADDGIANNNYICVYALQLRR